MGILLKNAIEHWKYIDPITKQPENEHDYHALVGHLDEILDMMGDDDRHPLVGLADIISDQISHYENKHHNKVTASGVDALLFLMEEHQLTQSDFKNEIGSQGVVSEILNGRRKLNLNHIKKLAERFHVSPETFID